MDVATLAAVMADSGVKVVGGEASPGDAMPAERILVALHAVGKGQATLRYANPHGTIEQFAAIAKEEYGIEADTLIVFTQAGTEVDRSTTLANEGIGKLG